MKKCLAALTASVMALGSLSALAVQAEEVALPGDVDGDGYITGHDSALLCRSLVEEDFSLTEEEYARADATADGVVNREDLDWLRANEEYQIGDLDLDGMSNLRDVWYILIAMTPEENVHLNTLEYTLADYTADREVHTDDLYALLMRFSWDSIGVLNDSRENHVEVGTYYSFDYKRGDFDGDGLVTYHDVALMQFSKYREGEYGLNDSLFFLDTNWDGYMDDKDFEAIKTMVEYKEPYGHCDSTNNKDTLQSSYDAMMVTSYQDAEMLEIIDQSDADAMKPDGQICFWDDNRQRYVIGLTDYKLYDVTLDGKVAIEDAYSLLRASNRLAVGKSFFLPDGYYEYRLYEEDVRRIDIIKIPD